MGVKRRKNLVDKGISQVVLFFIDRPRLCKPLVTVHVLTRDTSDLSHTMPNYAKA